MRTYADNIGTIRNGVLFFPEQREVDIDETTEKEREDEAYF